MDNLKLKSIPEDEIEASIYFGSAHNPCDIKYLNLKRIDRNLYKADCRLYVDFENEDVAKNEELDFMTQLELKSTIKDKN